MTEAQKKEYEKPDDKDEWDKELRRRAQHGPIKLKIKETSGIQLTGYVFFAQKMRQLKALERSKAKKGKR